MKISKTLIISGIIILILAVIAAYLVLNKNESKVKSSLKVKIPSQQTSSQKEAYIYFTDKNNSALIAENNLVNFNTNTRKYAQNLISFLIQGPSSDDLMSPIPQGTRLLSLYIQDNNTAVLDFSDEIRENHPGGSQSEILTIYSIVNTLTLNINEIKKVKILINGNEAETLVGHIALKFPLKENLTIIK